MRVTMPSRSMRMKASWGQARRFVGWPRWRPGRPLSPTAAPCGRCARPCRRGCSRTAKSRTAGRRRPGRRPSRRCGGRIRYLIFCFLYSFGPSFISFQKPQNRSERRQFGTRSAAVLTVRRASQPRNATRSRFARLPSRGAAILIALRIRPKVPQRQMLPAMAASMSASLGLGVCGEQRGGRHDLARLAVAALHYLDLPRLLHPGPHRIVADRLDRRNLLLAAADTGVTQERTACHPDARCRRRTGPCRSRTWCRSGPITSRMTHSSGMSSGTSRSSLRR